MAKKTEEAAEGTVSKMEAVRQTLAAGIEKPQEAVTHIKEKFGLDVPTAIFSSYKSAINSKKGTTPGKRGRKAKATSSISGEPRNTTSSHEASAGNGIHLAKDVKSLVEKYGAEAVKGMADVFAN
jgi:hypothetical protein